MISCENNVVKYCFVVHVLWPSGEGSVEVCQWQRLFWRDSSKTTFVTLPYLKRPKKPRLVPSRYFRILWGEKIGNQDGLRRAGCHGKDRLLTPRALHSIQTAFSLKQSDLTRKSDWVRVWKKPESQGQGYIDSTQTSPKRKVCIVLVAIDKENAYGWFIGVKQAQG